jgi:hypothetical protein
VQSAVVLGGAVLRSTPVSALRVGPVSQSVSPSVDRSVRLLTVRSPSTDRQTDRQVRTPGRLAASAKRAICKPDDERTNEAGPVGTPSSRPLEGASAARCLHDRTVTSVHLRDLPHTFNQGRRTQEGRRGYGTERRTPGSSRGRPGRLAAAGSDPPHRHATTLHPTGTSRNGVRHAFCLLE